MSSGAVPAAELMRQGIAKVGEEIQLVTRALIMVENIESRLKLLEPLYAAVQQVVSVERSGKL